MPTETLLRPTFADTLPIAPSSSPARLPERTRPSSSLEWLDRLRLWAILAVVVIHAIGTATRESGTGWHTAPWWFANFINSACLWCVPVFVMVSGALMLDPSRRAYGHHFLRRRMSKILVPLAFWVGVYLVFQRQFYGIDLSWSDTWKSLASGDPFLQLYFLFIVAGLTLLTPVLRRLITHSSRRELQVFTAVALGFGLAEHAFRELGGGSLNAVTRCLPYVGYYLAGHLLATATISPRQQQLARRLAVVGWLATAFGSGFLAAYYGWTTGGYFLYDYLSPTVMLMSLALFVGARGWRPKRISVRRLRQYGGATFGVFLIHPLLLFPVMRALDLPDGHDISRTVAWAVPIALVVCVVSGAISLVLCKVPGVRRLIA
jgi:surface polysaccharide O-acyltransferase-like enzyme